MARCPYLLACVASLSLKNIIQTGLRWSPFRHERNCIIILWPSPYCGVHSHFGARDSLRRSLELLFAISIEASRMPRQQRSKLIKTGHGLPAREVRLQTLPSFGRPPVAGYRWRIRRPRHRLQKILIRRIGAEHRNRKAIFAGGKYVLYSTRKKTNKAILMPARRAKKKQTRIETIWSQRQLQSRRKIPLLTEIKYKISADPCSDIRALHAEPR